MRVLESALAQATALFSSMPNSIAPSFSAQPDLKFVGVETAGEGATWPA